MADEQKQGIEFLRANGEGRKVGDAWKLKVEGFGNHTWPGRDGGPSRDSVYVIFEGRDEVLGLNVGNTNVLSSAVGGMDLKGKSAENFPAALIGQEFNLRVIDTQSEYKNGFLLERIIPPVSEDVPF